METRGAGERRRRAPPCASPRGDHGQPASIVEQWQLEQPLACLPAWLGWWSFVEGAERGAVGVFIGGD
jgi:hypothetical protein